MFVKDLSRSGHSNQVRVPWQGSGRRRVRLGQVAMPSGEALWGIFLAANPDSGFTRMMPDGPIGAPSTSYAIWMMGAVEGAAQEVLWGVVGADQMAPYIAQWQAAHGVAVVTPYAYGASPLPSAPIPPGYVLVQDSPSGPAYLAPIPTTQAAGIAVPVPTPTPAAVGAVIVAPTPRPPWQIPPGSYGAGWTDTIGGTGFYDVGMDPPAPIAALYGWAKNASGQWVQIAPLTLAQVQVAMSSAPPPKPGMLPLPGGGWYSPTLVVPAPGPVGPGVFAPTPAAYAAAPGPPTGTPVDQHAGGTPVVLAPAPAPWYQSPVVLVGGGLVVLLLLMRR